MKRKLAAVVVCVAMLGIAGGQPPPADVPPLTTSTPPLIDPAAVGGGGLIPVPSVHATAPPVAPVPPTFDTLIQELQTVRTQKAELEKREKAVTEALLKKFAEQKSQLEALGIPVNPPKPVAPAPEIADLLPPAVDKK
jgi:hypothetical protein